MRYPYIDHYGVQHGVIGSCQGNEPSADGRSRARQHNVEFSLATIKALIVTHVHIDHVGRISYLLAAGYIGPIFGSEPSAKLLPIVLGDAFQPGCSRDSKEIARYLKLVEQRLHPLPNNQWFVLLETSQLCVHIHLQRAGHVLGSAYVTIELTYPVTGENKRVVFSGNLCAPHAPLLIPPKSPERADILVLESTYGDRLHEDRASRRQRLEAVIEHALQDNGTVLIPAFSIGRTHRSCYTSWKRSFTAKRRPQRACRLPPRAPNPPFPPGRRLERAGLAATPAPRWNSTGPNFPLSSIPPLAPRFTEAYRSLKPYWNREARQRVEAGRDPLAFENLIMIDSHADHIAVLNHLAQTARPAIVIAGNGMCSGGRIVNYLKAMLHDARHDMLFVGYQAQGTPGFAIQQYGPKGGYVDLDGKRFDVRAKVTSIGGYSAHADQKGLVGFATGMQEWPGEIRVIRVVHGEKDAKRR